MKASEDQGTLALVLAFAVGAALLAQTWLYGNYLNELDRKTAALEVRSAQQTATIAAEADAITRLCKQIEGCVNR